MRLSTTLLILTVVLLAAVVVVVNGRRRVAGRAQPRPVPPPPRERSQPAYCLFRVDKGSRRRGVRSRVMFYYDNTRNYCRKFLYKGMYFNF